MTESFITPIVYLFKFISKLLLFILGFNSIFVVGTRMLIHHDNKTNDYAGLDVLSYGAIGDGVIDDSDVSS